MITRLCKGFVKIWLIRVKYLCALGKNDFHYPGKLLCCFVDARTPFVLKCSKFCQIYFYPIAKFRISGLQLFVQAAQNLINNPEVRLSIERAQNPYGDGHAAQRIVDSVLQFQEI